MDIKEIAGWGVNMVRIPVGYWMFDADPLPYIPTPVKYLDNAIKWCRKYNVKVLIDFHGLPDSQNGFDNSGHYGAANWNPADMRAPLVIGQIAERYKNDYDTVTGIQGANEPFPFNLHRGQKEVAVLSSDTGLL
jgi:glucan 1,3-beta-glucosidase